MKRIFYSLIAVVLAAATACAAGLSTDARSVIPSDVQQLIAVDYRQMNNSATATELYDRVLPPDLKLFETALRGVGINPQRDIDGLVFASFRSNGQLYLLGEAEGQFALRQIITRLRARKIKPTRFEDAALYSMGNGMQMSLLNDSAMIFGNSEALKLGLQARKGEIPSVNGNASLIDLIPEVESGALWSVLDQTGTQTMLRSVLGEASSLAGYEELRKHLLGSRYAMNFSNGVNFDLDVITSDSMTASTLSTLVQAGVMYKRMQSSGIEKTALQDVSVNSDSEKLQLHFKTDDSNFQSLLHSDLFAAVSR